MDEYRLRTRDPDLNGAAVLVVGAGRSGMAAARFAAARGARVVVSDRRAEGELSNEIRAARGLGFELRAGGNPSGLAASADLVVVSPGVSPELPLLVEARRLKLPIWGEIELGARFCRGHVIGITGSNGKSTVTTMVGSILRGAGVAGGTGGNLAEPFTDLLSRDAPDAWHALELSSFQLETVESLRAEIALVLNLSADHLDRYASLDHYARAKSRLLELQEARAYAVLNADDEASDRFRGSVRGRLHLFSTERPVDAGAFVRNGHMVLRTPHGEDELVDAADLPLPGKHNLANALAAALACRLAGCATEAIVEGLRGYRPLPHRLERVADVGEVSFYNDSKATNPASTACALSAFGPGKVHLILGGRDKGADWSALPALIAIHARRVLLVGEAADRLEPLVAPAAAVERCGTIRQAVEAGLRGAAPGEVVLLSPGCASFDQYDNFERRGEDFANAVHELARGDDG